MPLCAMVRCQTLAHLLYIDLAVPPLGTQAPILASLYMHNFKVAYNPMVDQQLIKRVFQTLFQCAQLHQVIYHFMCVS
jgi:hypothetical protein